MEWRGRCGDAQPQHRNADRAPDLMRLAPRLGLGRIPHRAPGTVLRAGAPRPGVAQSPRPALRLALAHDPERPGHRVGRRPAAAPRRNPATASPVPSTLTAYATAPAGRSSATVGCRWRCRDGAADLSLRQLIPPMPPDKVQWVQRYSVPALNPSRLRAPKVTLLIAPSRSEKHTGACRCASRGAMLGSTGGVLWGSLCIGTAVDWRASSRAGGTPSGPTRGRERWSGHTRREPGAIYCGAGHNSSPRTPCCASNCWSYAAASRARQ